MDIISNRNIVGQRLKIDGKHFVDCTLQACILEYSGGPMTLERTHITECQHLFRGAAQRTISFLEVMGLMDVMAKTWVEGPEPVH